MKAAVIEAFNEPLVVKEVPTPRPGPGEILVKIHACGVCNGDVDAHEGIFPEFASPVPPRIPGHRGAGTVVEIGAGVTRVKEGDRVGVPLIHWSCGECSYCFDGLHMLCPQVKLTGFQADGGYAEYLKADARYVGMIPDELTLDQAAHLTCTGVTAWGAIKAADVKPGDWCAIFGLGAVGEYMLQFARSYGLRVVAVSAWDEALEIAKNNGAEVLINSRSNDPGAAIKEETGGVHGVIVNSVKPEPFRQAFDALRPKGTLVTIGLPIADMALPIFPMTVQEITVRGSFVGSRNDLEEAYSVAVRDGIHMDTEEVPLDAVNDVYKKIREGKTTSRILLRP
jgi:propanol-preferring alcohol dehydrogenase